MTIPLGSEWSYQGGCPSALTQAPNEESRAETEWEKAARCGDNRRYPWGEEDGDEMHANLYEGAIGHPTSVGMYPAGVTLTTELYDLSGNVWEWTLSRYRQYPYDSRDGRNNLDADGDPVVRGGSRDLSQ